MILCFKQTIELCLIFYKNYVVKLQMCNFDMLNERLKKHPNLIITI